MKLYLTDTAPNYITNQFTAVGTSTLQAEDMPRAYEQVLSPPQQFANAINAIADAYNYANSTTHIGGQSMYSGFTSYVQSSTYATNLSTYLSTFSPTAITIAHNAVTIPDLNPGDVILVANNISNTTGQFLKITRTV